MRTQRFETKTPDAGSRFAERRSAPRLAFVAPIEMIDPITKAHVAGRVADISQHGCFVEAENLLTVHSVVQLRIHWGAEIFSTWAQVVRNRVNGMGLHFIDTSHEQAEVLAGWLEGLERN